MAEKKQEDAFIDPPIKDIPIMGFKDGKLSSKEILFQLLLEEEKDSTRTPNERVHGVLEAMGIRDKASPYLQKIINTGGNPEAIANVQIEGAKELTSMLDDAANRIKQPNFENWVQDQQHQIKSLSIPDENKALKLSDFNNLVEFIRTKEKTFPNGFDIAPEDVLGIMAHYQPTATRPRPKESGQGPKSPGQAI